MNPAAPHPRVRFAPSPGTWSVSAGMFGFRMAELLQSTESAEERKAPKVSFT